MAESGNSTSTDLPPFPWTGQCSCGHIRYSLHATPIVIHSCHCHTCQIETGSACAINLVIETTNMKIDQGQPLAIPTPSQSGKNQLIHRCPQCYVALFSHYAGSGPYTAFVRFGTLDQEFANHLRPDLFIFQETKMPWFAVPAGGRTFEKFYKPREEWGKENWARFEALLPKVGEWKEKEGGWEVKKIEKDEGKGLEKKMAELKVEETPGKL